MSSTCGYCKSLLISRNASNQAGGDDLRPLDAGPERSNEREGRRRSRLRQVLLLLGALGAWTPGCASPQATLQLQALQMGQQLPRLLEAEGTLHSGDQFLLSVKVPQAAYVYALRPTHDKPERFFPQAGHILAQPGTTLYIPGEGTYLTVGSGRGRELVIVVASLRQLDDESLQRLVIEKTGMRARDIGSSVENSAGEGNKTPEKKVDPTPPKPTGPSDRPGRRYMVHARLDKTHDAVLNFIFNHEPATLPTAPN